MPREEHFPIAGDGWGVYHWPEFRALMLRLGVPIDEKRTTRITLTVGEGEVVLIDHQYLGEDRTPKEDVPNVIDTTSMKNEHWRTRVPRSNPSAG